MGKRVAWMQERWQCSVMLAFMGGMLGQRTRLKVRRLALAYANVGLYVFSFIVFIRSAFWGKKMGGCTSVCIMPRGMLHEVMQQTAPVKTP